MLVKNDAFGIQTHQLFYMLTCLNQHRAAVIEWSKAVLHIWTAATSIPRYVSDWCGHGFTSHS